MPKNKPHKGLQKRTRITKTGLLRHKSAYHKHLRSGKGGKRLRQMRRPGYMASADVKRLEKLFFRRLRGRTQPKTSLRRSPSPEQRRAAEAAAATGE
jgi:large subunit ribosomal protein L35